MELELVTRGCPTSTQIMLEEIAKQQAKLTAEQIIDFLCMSQCNDWRGISTNPKPETSVRIFVIPNDRWNELLEASK